ADAEPAIRHEPRAQPPAYLVHQVPHPALCRHRQCVNARDMLLECDYDMAFGSGCVGGERNGVLGIDPDPSCRYGAVRAVHERRLASGAGDVVTALATPLSLAGGKYLCMRHVVLLLLWATAALGQQYEVGA